MKTPEKNAGGGKSLCTRTSMGAIASPTYSAQKPPRVLQRQSWTVRSHQLIPLPATVPLPVLGNYAVGLLQEARNGSGRTRLSSPNRAYKELLLFLPPHVMHPLTWTGVPHPPQLIRVAPFPHLSWNQRNHRSILTSRMKASTLPWKRPAIRSQRWRKTSRKTTSVMTTSMLTSATM